MAFDPVPELVAAIARGEMVVMLDDEDRENEGDLIMAASAVQPQHVNFMARHARGLICLAITQARAEKLALRPMVSDNRTPYRTNFTVSIEAAHGVTTGISAADRATTIQAAVANSATAADLVQPGHVFPLVAQEGGVLNRAGHTEAAVDLARLAGLEPAGVLVEVLNDDGTMARRPQLESFAREHGLKIGTVADLIRHRLTTENNVSRVLERQIDTVFGRFLLIAYRHALDEQLHLALIAGTLSSTGAPLVRVQVEDPLADSLGITGVGTPQASARALQALARDGAGVLVVLGEPSSAATRLARLTALDDSADGDGSGLRQWRQIGLGAQILRDLGVRRIRVLGPRRRFVGLSGFGIEVVDYVDLP